MKTNIFIIALLSGVLFFTTACNNALIINNETSISDAKETLYIYEDGKMKLGSRFLNKKDVVIYDDGKGGEKAGVKVYVPLHSDFYRDSITVVRIQNNYEKSIAQAETEKNENLN